MSFLVSSLEHLIEKDNLLLKVNAIIDFRSIATKLQFSLAKEFRTGNIPYNYLSLFKVLLIQQWHQLSDPKMEEALKTRIDFMYFSSFGLANKNMLVPDETTICRFRNKLIKANLLTELLLEVNHQLEQHSLKIKISQGAILDATLIESSTKSRAKPKLIDEDRQESEIVSSTSLSANEQSYLEVDQEAKWLKKGNKSIFGYKLFVATDIEDGYYEHLEVTPANVSEVASFSEVMQPVLEQHPKVVYADKGYASAKNREILAQYNVKDGIMEKAVKNSPLSQKQKEKNKQISQIRYIVERTNATTKNPNIFGFCRAKYLGIIKVKAQATLVAISHNLLKACNKIQLIQDSAIQKRRKPVIEWLF